ncbi:hypothetical protein F5879DRAFT_969471 [Lentinula edodes]|nr:hypothetical protein F5879DRAFT_969471 [Lentinula edodes]
MAHFSEFRIEEQIWLGPDDKFVLQNRLSAAKRHIETLDEQIKKLDCTCDTHISDLMHQKDTKLLEIASLRNILSPVRRIPVELLSKIFELSCSPDYHFYPQYDIIRYTFILSRVCVSWRTIAYATPRIWTRLCLSISEHSKAITKNVGWVQDWLSRSLALPIELYLNTVTDNNDHIIGMCRILESVMEHSHRIRLLELSGYSDPFHPIFVLPPSSFPVLEKISIEMYDDFLPPEIPRPIRAFLGAPKLSDIKIIRPHSIYTLEPLSLPTKQIATLTIDGSRELITHDPLVYAGILQQCQNLVSLDINPPSFFGFSSTLSISLPTLKHLRITCRRLRRGVSLLSCLTAPLLEDITVCWSGVIFEEFSREVLQLQSRSAAVLTSLTLDIDWMNTNSDLLSIPTLFPNLIKFRIRPIYNANALFQVMTYSTSQNFVLLPRLSTLDLEFQQQDNVPYPSELIAMLLSRSWPLADSIQPDAGHSGERLVASDYVGTLSRLQMLKIHGYTLKDADVECITGIHGLHFDYRSKL